MTVGGRKFQVACAALMKSYDKNTLHVSYCLDGASLMDRKLNIERGCSIDGALHEVSAWKLWAQA